jgi:hypothetical protein
MIKLYISLSIAKSGRMQGVSMKHNAYDWRPTGREKDVKVPRLHQKRFTRDHFPIVSRLHDGTIAPFDGIRQRIKVAHEQSMERERFP